MGRTGRTGAPAATPSRGHGNPRLGVSVSSRWGWVPSASARKSGRTRRIAHGFVVTAGIVAGVSLLVSAQPSSRIPRLPDGRPDLQGMYDLAMLTPLERPAGLPAVLTDEQAAKLEQQAE